MQALGGVSYSFGKAGPGVLQEVLLKFSDAVCREELVGLDDSCHSFFFLVPVMRPGWPANLACVVQNTVAAMQE